jgi:hypothetical protein
MGKSAARLGVQARRAQVTDARPAKRRNGAMTSSPTYDGWWDLSLIDERNERPLHAAFVAVIAVWATAFLFALV